MKILLIEDDQMIGESLEQSLGHDGYTINWCRNAKTAELALKNESYSLVLLDLGLPDRCGIELLREIRAQKLSTPVLILTARDSVQDRVLGLNTGADDYLVKPFALAELEARIRALLRRVTGHMDTELSYGDFCLNTVTKILRYREQEFTLSAREYAVMYALLEIPGKVWSRIQLEERIYGWQEEVESNAVEFHIHQLRKKLGQQVIINIRGMGYRVHKAEHS